MKSEVYRHLVHNIAAAEFRTHGVVIYRTVTNVCGQLRDAEFSIPRAVENSCSVDLDFVLNKRASMFVICICRPYFMPALHFCHRKIVNNKLKTHS